MKQTSKGKSGIYLTETDIELFRYLYENKVATAAQIRRDFYPSLNFRSVQNRLGKMIKLGFITAQQMRDLGGKAVYSLSKRSFRRYIKPLGINLREQINSAAIHHDLDLLEIRHRLETSPKIKRYVPENLIGLNEISGDEDFLSYGINADAHIQLVLKDTIFLVTLEYEYSRKFDDRYQDLFRRYYHNKFIPGVLYVCRDDALLKRVRRIEKRCLDDNRAKFYYSNFSSWKEGEPVEFTNLNGSWFKL